MPETAAGEARGWRTIDELGALVGAYCWLEHRIFEVTGAWATGPIDEGAELRVWLAAISRRHGVLVGRWAECLPMRAGIEPAALVTVPAEPKELAGAFEQLEMTEPGVGVSALVETVLPWVGGVYECHLAAAIPVAEASVMEVLVEARREGLAEIRGGRALLGRSPRAGTPSRHLAEVFKRSFTPVRVTPAVRPG